MRSLLVIILVFCVNVAFAAKTPNGKIYYSECEDGILMHIHIERGDASQRGGIVIEKPKKTNYEFEEYKKTETKNFGAEFFTTTNEISFQWITLPSVSSFTVYVLIKNVPNNIPIKKMSKFKGKFFYIEPKKGREKDVKLKEDKKTPQVNPKVVVEPEPLPEPVKDTIVPVKDTIVVQPVKDTITVQPVKDSSEVTKQRKRKKRKKSAVEKRPHFRIQLSARSTGVPIEDYKNYYLTTYHIDNVKQETTKVNGITIYKYVGEPIASYRQAQITRNLYVSKGIIDAFIVGYIKGQRVNIQQAIDAQKK